MSLKEDYKHTFSVVKKIYNDSNLKSCFFLSIVFSGPGSSCQKRGQRQEVISEEHPTSGRAKMGPNYQ
jgi:hypothetical protein